MSQDEINRDLRRLTKSGQMDAAVAREAMRQPLEGEKLVRLHKIEQETARQSVALFGDKDLGIPGLIADVRFLKVNYWRAVWTLAGGMAVGGALIAGAITILGFWIEYHKP